MSTWAGFSDAEICNVKSSQISKKPVKKEQNLHQKTSSSNVKQANDVDLNAISVKESPANIEPNWDHSESGEDDTLSDSPSIKLEDLHLQQKMIEEENKKKKELLERTLKERYEQTVHQNNTLHKVKEELEKLDQLVTRDVMILRNRIEEANRTYTSARKHFEEAEKEYLAAKLALHEATESKELLSEHLCAIIQNNEVRKSKKLGELMSTLDLELEDKNITNHSATQYLKTPTPDSSNWRTPKSAAVSKPKPPPAISLGSSMIAIHRMD